MRRISTVLAILAAILLTDVHWSVLQTITWVEMVRTSSSDAGLVDRVVETVTGAVTCDHCIALADERSSEPEELLDLLAKSQFLAPIRSGSLGLSHGSESLFRLAPLESPSWLPPCYDIEHPPRTA